MYDLDAIEAINVDQIVTATDRLLFGNLRKKKTLARGTADLTVAARRALARSRADNECTVYVRQRPQDVSYVTVLGACAATLWLGVALLCFLT